MKRRISDEKLGVHTLSQDYPPALWQLSLILSEIANSSNSTREDTGKQKEAPDEEDR